MEKLDEKVKVIVSVESCGGSQGSECSARSRRRGPGSESERTKSEVGKKVTCIFRFQKWTHSRRFKTGWGLRKLEEVGTRQNGG